MIISYAQNFEDIMLWRALGHIDGGFYIDVGAQDPQLHSVTKFFYDKGWRGINIDPVPEWASKLETARPGDINLAVAAGVENAEKDFYIFPDTGLSTFSKEIAERHEQTGEFSANVSHVRIRKLSDICRAHCTGEIHFLKIDVEGAEKEVLLGMDFDAFRPWIVLVESTLPLLEHQSYSEWDSILRSSNYEYVYFDGLNRFYISEEKLSELRVHFDRPPNVFDQFELDRVIRAREEINQLGQTLAQLSAELNAVNQANSSLWQASEAQKLKIEAITDSASWKVTAPLRWLARPTVNRGQNLGIPKPSLTTRLILWGMARPWLVRCVHSVADLVPPLRRAITHRVALVTTSPAHHSEKSECSPRIDADQLVEYSHLTPRAQQLYRDLKTAIDSRKEESD